MNLIKSEENDKKNKNNKIIEFLNHIKTIANNYMYKYKYIFLDVLLNEWYKINKTLLKEKLDEFKDTNTLFFYN